MSTRRNILSTLNPARRGLRYGLLVAFLLLVLVPIIVLTTTNLIRGTRLEITNALERLDFVVNSQQEELTTFTVNTANSLSGVLEDPVPRGNVFLLLERQGFQPEVEETVTETGVDPQQQEFQAFTTRLIVDTNARFDRVLLLNADGYVIGANEILVIGRNFGDQVWFRNGLTPEAAEGIGTPVTNTATVFGPIGDAMATTGEERLSYYFTVPVTDPSTGEPLGMLVGRVRTQTVASLLNETAGLGETGELLLLDQELNVLNTPRMAEGSLSTLESNIAVSAIQGDDIPRRWQDYRGEQVFGTYTAIDPLNLTLIAKQDVSEVAVAQRGILLTNLVLGAGIAALALVTGVVVAGQITRPLEELTTTASRLAEGQMDTAEPDTDVAEIKQLASTFNMMNDRVNELMQRQEATIKDRTRQLEITAQMGRIIAAETDLERLMNVTVDMIRDRLGYYHAQVFLIDDLRQYAVLRASTGEAGRALLERQHKLQVGSQSVIGRVTDGGRPVLAADTEDSPVHKRNELLPDTRAELAVPLRIGDQIIGALDIQSVNPEAFDEGTVSVLQTVADQLAVAIRNAQLFTEREGLLSSSLQLTRMLTRESWREYAEERSIENPSGYEYDLSSVRPLDEGPHGNGGGRTTNGNALRMPIEVRGEEIGTLEAEIGEGEQLGEAERELVEQVLNRMALALDNARLFNQTQESLSETARLYDASQLIADATTSTDLTERLLSLMGDVEPVDRAMLYTLADPDETGESRQVLYVGYYDETEGEATVFDLPDRLQTDDPVLQGIEAVPKDGIVNVDVRELDNPLGVTSADVISQAIFPLVSAGQTLAWLVLQNRRTPGAFPQDDVLFFQTVADQSATVLSTARLLDQTAARARRLQAVNEVTRSSTSILNIDVLMPIVVNQVASAFGYYHVQIFRVGETGAWANLVASTGEVGQELLRRKHRLKVGSQSVIGRVTSTGEIIIARDTDEDAVHRKNELLPDTRAELAVPIKTGERVIGALDVQSTQPNAFDEEAVLILQSLADQISVALENAQLFKEIQDRVTELSTINSVSQAVSRTDTLEDLYRVVGEELVKTFGATYGFLGLRRDDMIELPVFIENGQHIEPPPPTPVGQGLTSIVLETGQKMLINSNAEQAAEEKGAIVVGDLPASLLIVPLTIGESVIGAVSIQSDEEYAFDDSHERQLNTLANYIAIKIRNNELLLDTKRSAAELGFLFNMTRAAVQTTDLDDALASVANIIQYELDDAETATIYLRERDQLEGEMVLVPHASSGYAADIAHTLAMGEGLVGRAAEERQPIILQDAHSEGAAGTSPETRAALVVPLVVGREVIGAISVGSTQVGVFDEADIDLLEAASGTLTAVIQNAQLLEQIEATNEELRQLDQLKTQFLANMSHELRTPLNSIIGFSKVILNEIDGPLTELQRQDLSTIHESGKHLLGLINDILDMSKIEAGKMEVHNEFMEMDDIVKGVMSTSIALVKDKPVDLVDDLPSQMPVVYADSKRVRQVLLNLMSNAAKFTHEGSITLKVREYNSDPEHDIDGPHIRISVIDTGIGISDQDTPLLFEPFRQVDGSTTRQVGGTGLGLPITKEFIELMGGRIWVESEVGMGSTFSFTLPVQPPVGVETTPTGQLIDRSKPIILAVDDEPRVLDLYRRYLDNDDFSMVGVPSAQNIVERVRNVRPTLIIMDLALPGKDGWQALDEIKQEPDISHIPIVICSIHDERTRGMEAGAAGYLTKPVIEEDLLSMVDNVLEGVDLDQQTVATTMHEPVYDAHEREAFQNEAVSMAESIAEERDATLEDADPVTVDAEPAIAGGAPAEAGNLDEVAEALTGDSSPVPSGPTFAPAVPREGEAIRTLIIDPDEAYAGALSELLEETEMFSTQVTHKGFAGLGAADQGRPHVIILDVDIDDMDGLGLLAAMRSSPGTKNVPVIILTERDLTEEQLEPFADGITAYINKLDHDADSLLMELDEVIAILLYGFDE